MPLARMNLPGVFGPTELVALSTAYDLALNKVSEHDARCLRKNARDVRRRLAAGIIAAAQSGVLDTEDLATEGLRNLDAAEAWASGSSLSLG